LTETDDIVNAAQFNVDECSGVFKSAGAEKINQGMVHRIGLQLPENTCIKPALL
jgi:hypothetical protein